MPRINPNPVSPPLGSMEHLLPPKERSPEQTQPPRKVHQLIRQPDMAGKEELAIVGAIAGLLLAGVLVGAAFLPKEEGPDRMAALRKKFTATETEPTTTTAKHTDKTKMRRLDRRGEEQAIDQLEPDTTEAETDEETTVLFQEESRSTKKAKARTKPKSRSRSVTPRPATEA